MSSFIWALAFVLSVIGATVGTTRKVTEGNEALVERLGRYHRKLGPGLNFGIIPFVDEVVVEASIKEKILDISPDETEATTEDNVRVKVDSVVFWKIFDLENAYYAIEDVAEGIKNLVITTLRAEIGQMTLQETNSGRDRIIRALLEILDEATEPWGVKVTRVEIQDIKPPQSVIDALEREREAQSKKRAAIAVAEGEKQAAINSAQAIAESIKEIQRVMSPEASTQEILRYLVAQRYVEANQQLGQSPNSKVVFMNPRDLTQSMAELIEGELRPDGPRSQPPNRGNGSSQS